jgi:hypothetical protein
VFSIAWICHEVYTTNVISDNAVLLTVISLLGPSLAMIVRKAPAEASLSFLSNILRKSGHTPSFTDDSDDDEVPKVDYDG